MRKLICLLFCLVLLTFGGNSFAWDFSKYSSTSQNSTFATSNYSPTSYAYAAPTAFATAWGCSSCQTLTTYAETTSYAVSGANRFSASATAYAEAESYPNFNCNEPPVCEDGDDDGVCDESDNCIADPNTPQEDYDDDQVGDVCDNCPDNANTDQADWDLNGVGDVCDPTGCDGYQLPECPDGIPTDPNADCTPQYPDFGTCEPVGCDDCPPPPCIDDIDQDLICDEDDPCPEDPTNTCDDPPPCDLTCQLAEACPCENDWVNHGAYVVCVGAFERDHRGEPGIGDVVNLAGNSDCGGSHVGTPN